MKTLLLSVLFSATLFAQAQKGKMMHANGSFEVKLTPQGSTSETKPDPMRGRMSIDKQFHGGLEGTSQGEMLTGGDPAAGSAGYVAIERVTGTLDGKSGSFLLQHSATMHAGQLSLTITVIPGSGSEQLVGLSGSMKIVIEGGKHSYSFEYLLP